jgi:nitrite reductase (NADH) small subunit
MIRICTKDYKLEKDNMSNWIEVVALQDIPKLGSRVIKTDAMNIAVFRTAGDEVFAMKDECPHKKGPLSQGIVHGSTVTCPLHNWKIDLASGEALGPDEGCTNVFPAKVENGKVYISFSVAVAA